MFVAKKHPPWKQSSTARYLSQWSMLDSHARFFSGRIVIRWQVQKRQWILIWSKMSRGFLVDCEDFWAINKGNLQYPLNNGELSNILLLMAEILGISKYLQGVYTSQGVSRISEPSTVSFKVLLKKKANNHRFIHPRWLARFLNHQQYYAKHNKQTKQTKNGLSIWPSWWFQPVLKIWSFPHG